MSRATTGMPEELRDYLLRVSLREPEVLRRLREETARHPEARMQISPEQGQLMGLLVRAIGARCAIEVGVFTGYSSIVVALALPADGRLVACDLSPVHTAVARRYWRAAGVEHKIELRLGSALDTLDALLRAGEAARYDFAFIDADKEGYAAYFERLLALLRPGGLIAVDNVLWSGRVIDPGHDADPDTLAIRSFNERLLRDERVALSLVPIGDGLTLALKL
jgi:predicted O-methyltransferase YrrM